MSVSYGTLQAFLQHQWRVGLVSFVPRGWEGAPPFSGLDFFRTIPLDYHNSPRHYFRSLITPLPFTAQKYRSSAYGIAINEAMTKLQPDVVFCDHLHTALYGSWVRQAFSVPVVLRVHNAEHELWRKTARYYGAVPTKMLTLFQAWKMWRYERRLWPGFDRVIFLSPEDAARCWGAPRSVVIPPGVDSTALPPQPVSPQHHVLLFVGSLDWIPNVEGLQWFLRKVWEPLRQAMPDLKFYVVGKNPPEHLQRRRIPGVTVTGFVPDLRDYIRRGGVMVVPLRIGSGVRIKILEGLAMGIPIVTTPTGIQGLPQLRDVVRIAESEGSFVHEVLRLFASPEEYWALRQRGLQKIRQMFSWDRIGDRLVTLLQEMVNKASTQGHVPGVRRC